jgi:hypothetical protein
MCRHLREPGHRDIGGRCALDDRYYHPRGKEGKGRQKTDMAFDPAFSLSDFGEGGGATFHEIIDQLRAFAIAASNASRPSELMVGRDNGE